MQNLEEFKQLVNGSPIKVVITTHHKPDADALGSSLAFYNYLIAKGHQVKVISPTDYPRFLFWMHGQNEVMVFNDPKQTALATSLIADADLICCLDFSALSRINEMGPFIGEAKAPKLLVDHHLNPEDFAKYVQWDSHAAATCELIFDLIVALGDTSLINKEIAECLYAGIMTDTGSFRHPVTSAKVHRTIASLIECGADNSRVHKLIYDNSNESRLRMLGHILLNRLVVLHEYATAYIAITRDELKTFNSLTGDTEGFVNYALSIEGIVMAALIIDRTEAVKMSFRSTGSFSVNKFARDNFEGGGHANASGGKSDLSLDETIAKFLSLLPQYQEELLQVSEQLNK
jgi:phosphoesterase RecJ-like protein